MALLVVWSHSFILHTGTEEGEWIFRLTNGTVTAGTVGVMAFFVISGFLITQSWERSKSLSAYAEKRVRRIYPGYMVATAICAFVVVPLFATNEQIGAVQAAKVIAHNLLLQNFFPHTDAFLANSYPGEVNGSLWSIPYEFGCYIGVALLGIAGLVTRGRLLIAMTALLLASRIALDLMGVQPHAGAVGVVLIWTQIAPSFLIGMVIYAYRETLPRSRAALIALAGGALAGCWIGVGNLLLAPALAYGVFYVAYSERLKLNDAARFGDFSYGTYLYAFVIQQMIEATIGDRLSLPAFIALSSVLSLAAGVLSWHLVERHFMKRGPKREPEAIALAW